MNRLFVVAFTFSCSICFAQYTYQNAKSIILNPNYIKNEASVETSFEFNHFQLTGIYNLSRKIFLHSDLTLNVLQQKADKFLSGLLGGKPIMLHNNDAGMGAGLGFQNIGRIGKMNMQLVFDYNYEKQNYKFDDDIIDANTDVVDSQSHQNTALYKVSSNLNLSKPPRSIM